MKVDLTEILSQLPSDCTDVVVGPVCQEDNVPTGHFYFMFAMSPDGADCMKFGPHVVLAYEVRHRLVIELMAKHQVHDMDDEYEMAQLCTKVWPTGAYAVVVAQMELEGEGGEKPPLLN